MDMKNLSITKHKDIVNIFLDQSVEIEVTFLFGFHKTLNKRDVILIESFYN